MRRGGRGPALPAFARRRRQDGVAGVREATSRSAMPPRAAAGTRPQPGDSALQRRRAPIRSPLITSSPLPGYPPFFVL